MTASSSARIGSAFRATGPRETYEGASLWELPSPTEDRAIRPTPPSICFTASSFEATRVHLPDGPRSHWSYSPPSPYSIRATIVFPSPPRDTSHCAMPGSSLPVASASFSSGRRACGSDVLVVAVFRLVRRRAPVRVEETASVALPGQTVALPGAVRLGNDVLRLLAGRDIEDVHVALLGSPLRERHRDALAVGRGDEPADRGRR